MFIECDLPYLVSMGILLDKRHSENQESYMVIKTMSEPHRSEREQMSHTRFILVMDRSPRFESIAFIGYVPLVSD